jgi:hypothetical protein
VDDAVARPAQFHAQTSHASREGEGEPASAQNQTKQRSMGGGCALGGDGREINVKQLTPPEASHLPARPAKVLFWAPSADALTPGSGIAVRMLSRPGLCNARESSQIGYTRQRCPETGWCKQ